MVLRTSFASDTSCNNDHHVLCYGFITLFVCFFNVTFWNRHTSNGIRRWLNFTKLISQKRIGSSLYRICLDLYVILVKLIVDGCFCSDLLSTGWSGGIDPPDSPFPASTGGGRARDAREAGGFGPGLFWRFGFYIWTWIIKPVPWKSSASCVLFACVRVSQAGMQLNRPKSAHLISSSPHSSSSYSSQFKSMRFSYHISSGLPSPQPVLRRSGESGAYLSLDHTLTCVCHFHFFSV